MTSCFTRRRNASAWSFIIPFERITVRIRVLRDDETRVHGLLLFHLKGLQYEFLFRSFRGNIYPMHHGLLLFHLKELQHVFVFYEAARRVLTLHIMALLCRTVSKLCSCTRTFAVSEVMSRL